MACQRKVGGGVEDEQRWHQAKVGGGVGASLILFIPDTSVNAQTYLQEGSSNKGNYTAFSKFQNNLYSLLNRSQPVPLGCRGNFQESDGLGNLLRKLIRNHQCTPVSAQTYLQERCGDRGNYAAHSKFQVNLSRLLSRGLYNEGPIYGFYNTTEGEDPDKVYGLFFLCRGDVAANLCPSCIRAACSTIIERCPGQKEAIIWYDECLVRYTNRSFFSSMETTPVIFIAKPADVSVTFNWIVEQTFDKEKDFEVEVSDLARNVTDLAISSESLYATINLNVSSSVTLHELVQCTPDISKLDCKSCLLSAIKEFPTVLNYKRGGGRIFQPSCNLRYKMYRSDQVPTNKTRTESGSKEKENSQEVLLLHLRQEIGEEFSKENSRGEKPVACQQLSLMRLDIIRTNTGNFSNECKLGEGGFAPVYKGTLADGKEIAVKRFSRTSGQGLIELKNEIILIARLQHRNLVRFGYMAPEYAMEGLFSVKSDVFSFGVLLLEIVSGHKNNGFHLQEEGESLLTFAWKLWSEGRVLELIDQLINESCNEIEVRKCVHVGLLCIQEDPADRPTMSLMVHNLGGDTITLSQPSQPAFSVGRDAKKLDRVMPTQGASTINGVTLSGVVAR
ncbi:cysteine-rich receptor-like protein kinase 10 [Eucalyptus grandis]|uniref:cysteine-rich receptor-like protein kinase 10 n=1 Tax=Eucalyptus grandis TaxID=71139 RepID=UPI00192F026E|nr:cysteine-rich receptor-like protein kinase 10 [Eucalyptus grandis]